MTRTISSQQDQKRPPKTAEEPCKICKTNDFTRQCICCDRCNIWHHRNCLGMPRKIFNELKNSEEIWLCPDCRVFRTPRTELPSGSEEDEENEIESHIPMSATINQTFEFSLTPARIPFIPISPRRRLPSLPIESSSSISSMLQLNDWDIDQSTIAPITCNMPRNGRMSQGDPSLQKFALKQHEPPNINMVEDTPCLPTTEDHIAEGTLPDLASSSS